MSASLVLVTTRSFGGGETDPAGRLAEAGLRVAYGSPDHDATALEPLLARSVAWIAGTGPVTAEHLHAAPRLRVLARHGTGVDAVDLAATARQGVTVTNTPGANAASVADHATALALALLRRLVEADRAVRAGAASPGCGRELGALTVGLVGFGAVGRLLTGRLAGFGSRVLAHDPYVRPARIAESGADPRAGLDELAAESDLLSLHLPGGGRPVVDAALLDRLPPGALLVNTARDDLLDEGAVAAALADGRLGGVAVDVHSGPRSPLLTAPRVVVTPHIGAHTLEAVDRMGGTAVDEVLRVLAGQSPRHPVSAGPGNDRQGV